MVNSEKVIDAVNYIKREIVPRLPTQITELIPENVQQLEDKLLVLSYYCLANHFDPRIDNRLTKIRDLTQSLYELLYANGTMFAYLKDMYKVRKLDFASNAIGEYEEMTSGEETFRDMILHFISIYLIWKSDSIWVKLAEKDHLAVIGDHASRIKRELWECISGLSSSNGDVSLERAITVGERLNELISIINSEEIPTLMRVLLIANVYLMLMRLNIDRVLIDFNTEESSRGQL